MLKIQTLNIESYLQNSFLPSFPLSSKSRLYIWYVLVGAIIALGIYLRVKQYVFNRSLWLDEAFLASQIARGDWSSFFSMPMEYSHIVPPLFLVLCRMFVTVFGDNDLALRAYPLVASVFSLLLCYQVSRQVASPWALVCGLLLFATSQELVFYASDLKPYATDAFFTLLLWRFLLRLLTASIDEFNRSLTYFALVGVLSLWASHPSIFTLAGMGLYLSYIYSVQQRWDTLVKLGIVGVLWLANFALIYFWINGGDPHKASPIGRWLYSFWHAEGGFMPHKFSDAVAWIKDALLKFFDDPLSFKNHKLAAILAALGLVVLLKNDRHLLSLLLLPLFLVFLATYFEKYVFFGRLVLFLTPIACLLIGIALAELSPLIFCQKPYPTWLYDVRGLFFGLQVYLCIILLHIPIRTEHVIEEVKPAITYLQQHMQKTDKIYLYKWVEPSVRYYAPLYGFDFRKCHTIGAASDKISGFKEIDFFRQHQSVPSVARVAETDCILGKSEQLEESKSELMAMKNMGVIWFLFSHADDGEKGRFMLFVGTLGAKKLDEQQYPGVSLYAYLF